MNYLRSLFEGRITRINYLVGGLIVFFAIGFLKGIFAPISFFTFGAVSIVLALVSLVYGVAFSVRRLYDIGKSWHWALWLLVPVVNFFFWLYLLFKPGEEKANKYGKPPEKKLNLEDLFKFSKLKALFPGKKSKK